MVTKIEQKRMTSMKKQLLSAVLAVCMTTALLPTAATAVNTQKTTTVTIAGKTLTDGMGWNNDGSTTTAGSASNNVYFKDGVLYLKDANIKAQGTALSASNGSLTISLDGDSRIDADATANNGMIEAVVFNADDNKNTAGDVLIQGEGMLEIESAYNGIVNDHSTGTKLEIKDVSVSIRGENSSMKMDSDLTLSGGAMLVATAQNACIEAGKLTITEYAALHAESDEGKGGDAISCTGVETKGYLAVYGDDSAIACDGNVAVTGGTAEVRVRRSADVPAWDVTAGHTVSTSGMYVHAGVSSLDAKQVTDFDTNYAAYGYTAILQDSNWLKWENGFEDVASTDWFYAYVSYVNQHSLMKGVEATRFSPNTTTTRSQAVQILYALSRQYWVQYGIDSGNRTSFVDVPSTEWYANPVRWAGGNGVVNGVGENRFSPDAPVTREQFAQILYKFTAKLGYDVSASAELTQFSDADQVSDWAEPAMKWAVGAGVMHGTDMGTLNPGGAMTRAQAAVMLHGFIQNTLSSGRT